MFIYLRYFALFRSNKTVAMHPTATVMANGIWFRVKPISIMPLFNISPVHKIRPKNTEDDDAATLPLQHSKPYDQRKTRAFKQIAFLTYNFTKTLYLYFQQTHKRLTSHTYHISLLMRDISILYGSIVFVALLHEEIIHTGSISSLITAIYLINVKQTCDVKKL